MVLLSDRSACGSNKKKGGLSKLNVIVIVVSIVVVFIVALVTLAIIFLYRAQRKPARRRMSTMSNVDMM